MKLIALFENEHPFRYAYPLKDNRLEAQVQQIYRRTCELFDYEGNCPSMPEVWLVSDEHLRDYASRGKVTDPRTIAYGLYNYAYPNKVFLSNKLNTNNRKHTAVVAHEFVHYLQYNSGKYDTITPDMIEQLENEADEIMSKY
jgi:hypothetical protein